MASAADGGLNVPEGALPPQFADLKREIAAATPGFETKLPAAWADLIAELATRTDQIAQAGSNYVPQVEFSELDTLSPQQVDTIKRRGCVLIRNVVDDSEAIKWREELQEYVKSNPDAEGFPENDKQFLQLYWTRPQVQARSHGNVLKASTFLNKLYDPTPTSADIGVDTSTPLSYADRFRLRKPGVQWDAHPPHVDGGSIERWQADSLRACFSDILTGDWRNHNPYLLEPRVRGRSSLYGRPNQSSVFRTYQGWLSLSDTAPGEGTLQVFPDVLLSNAYTIMRPFFKLKSRDADPMAADNWELDLESSAFPGILPRDGGFMGPRPTPQAHPHLALEKTMTSVPQVRPGDMVFWHCDLVHAVEREHAGENSSCVMYIPAVPHTPQNAAYVTRQRESFLKGDAPPDFPRHKGEGQFKGSGKEIDLGSEMGRHAMGFSAVA